MAEEGVGVPPGYAVLRWESRRHLSCQNTVYHRRNKEWNSWPHYSCIVRSGVDHVAAEWSAGGSLLLRRQKDRRKKLIIISIIFLLHLPLLLNVIIMVIITIANISFSIVIYITFNVIIISAIIYIIAIIIIIISNISIDIVSNESFFNFLIIFSLSLYFDNGYHYYCWYQP